MRSVEFLTLITWLLLAGTGTVLLPFVLTTPGAGLAALAGVGGLAACVLFMVLDAPIWASWVQVGMAVLGIIGASLAAAWLCDGSSLSGSTGEEVQASILGLQLPFFGVATFLAALLALQIVEPVV